MRLFFKIALIGAAALVLAQAQVQAQTRPNGNVSNRPPAAKPVIVVQNPFTGYYGQGTGNQFGNVSNYNWGFGGWSGGYNPGGVGGGYNPNGNNRGLNTNRGGTGGYWPGR